MTFKQHGFELNNTLMCESFAINAITVLYDLWLAESLNVDP